MGNHSTFHSKRGMSFCIQYLITRMGKYRSMLCNSNHIRQRHRTTPLIQRSKLIIISWLSVDEQSSLYLNYVLYFDKTYRVTSTIQIVRLHSEDSLNLTWADLLTVDSKNRNEIGGSISCGTPLFHVHLYR